MAHFVGVTRPGYPLGPRRSLSEGLGEPVGDSGAHHLFVRLPGASRRAAPIWYLVPDSVVRYIDKRRLYSDEA